MDRRSFLTFVGVGAGGLGSGLALGRRTDKSTPETATAPLEPSWRGEQRVVWSIPTDARAASLTFDDGPDPAFTPRILDILDAASVKATFFMLGHNAAQYPALLREVIAAGHEVGSHSWTHVNLTEASPHDIRTEIVRGTELVQEHGRVPVRLFRPPYGRFNETVLRVLAERPEEMYVWSVTRGELAWKDPAEVAAHVTTETGAGDIVDLHDGIGRGTFQRETEFAQRLIARRNVEIEALPEILDRLEEAGTRLTTLSDLEGLPRARTRS